MTVRGSRLSLAVSGGDKDIPVEVSQVISYFRESISSVSADK